MTNYNRPRTLAILDFIIAHAKTGIYTHQIAQHFGISGKKTRNSLDTLKQQGRIEGYGDTGAGRARAWVPAGSKGVQLAAYTKPNTTAALHLHRAANRAAAQATGTTGARLTTPCNGPGFTQPKPLYSISHAHADDSLTTAQRQWSSGQVVRALPHSTPGAVWHRQTYDGAELEPYTGRPGANDHKQCGSMVGGKWQPYKPPGLVCTGSPTKPTPTATTSGNSARKGQPSPLYGSTFCSKKERPSRAMWMPPRPDDLKPKK